MEHEPKKPGENSRNADFGRKDKGDEGKKFDKTRGADYQVSVADEKTSRDAVKEDRD